ncbi:MAG: DUF1461 domain-containing protein [Candidatus Woesearchaeota archaeon]|jgi:integral membrane protein (TIGR01906 family)|nr:DUF1461 domain-containing protein [Candidatus Woesearchaeota archaeon]MDP7610515.1 DUF1461 domain-containing protein [Candidatus Woesearchaeota archaeon]|tara:strand:+ start:2608 stop:3237 length:630 start_codon:yes stop_codon:yes gene_type:complete
MKRQHLLVLLLSVNLALLILLVNFNFMVFNESYYIEQFRKNDVYSKVPEAEQVLDNVFVFFEGKELSSEFFEEKEILHMKDVKRLIERGSYLLYSLVGSFLILVVVLIKTTNRNKVVKYLGFSLIAGGSIVIGVSLLLWLFDFSSLFTNFHLIFFPQGNWMFPSESMLIGLFPKAFFYDISFRIFRNSVITAVLLMIVGMFFVIPKRKS